MIILTPPWSLIPTSRDMQYSILVEGLVYQIMISIFHRCEGVEKIFFKYCKHQHYTFILAPPFGQKPYSRGQEITILVEDFLFLANITIKSLFLTDVRVEKTFLTIYAITLYSHTPLPTVWTPDSKGHKFHNFGRGV